MSSRHHNYYAYPHRRHHYYDYDYHAGFYPYADSYFYGPGYGSSYVYVDRQPEIRNYYSQDIYYVTSPAEQDDGQYVQAYPRTAIDGDQARQLIGPPAPSQVDEGLRAFRAGLFEDARRRFLHAVLEDERDGYAQFFYGLSHFAVGDYSAAALSLRQGLFNAPELINDPLDARAFYGDRILFEVQLDALARYVGAGTGGPEAAFLLGYVYFASAQPERAVVTLRRLTRAYPSDETAERVLAAASGVVNRNKPSS